MAALAIPAIEAVVARALVVMGVGAVAGAAGDAARKQQKEADEAKSTPIARTDAQTKTKEKCKDCAPDKGTPSLRNTAGWSDDSITYQMRIAQMPPAPPGFLMEWDFGGVKFDGFDSSNVRSRKRKRSMTSSLMITGKFADGGRPGLTR
jgi:hypothetical protein